MEQEKSCPTKKTTDNDSIASSPSSSDSSSLKDTPIEPSNSKWQKCTDCGKEFSSQAKFSAHMKTHSTSYPCTFQVGVAYKLDFLCYAVSFYDTYVVNGSIVSIFSVILDSVFPGN